MAEEKKMEERDPNDWRNYVVPFEDYSEKDSKVF